MKLEQMLTAMIPFIGTVGITIDHIGKGTAVASLPARPQVNNHLGTAHAGAVYTLGESASGGAVLSLFADLMPGVFVALKEATVRHSKAAAGDVLAQATVVGDPAEIRAAYEATGKVDFVVTVKLTVDGAETGENSYTWAVRAPRA